VHLTTAPSLPVAEDSSVAFEERDLLFGDSAQDIVSSVGAPARIFFKSEDKMRIHSASAARKSAAAARSDYFYNYFTLGFVSHLADN